MWSLSNRLFYFNLVTLMNMFQGVLEKEREGKFPQMEEIIFLIITFSIILFAWVINICLTFTLIA